MQTSAENLTEKSSAKPSQKTEIVPRHTFVFAFMSWVFRAYLRVGGFEVVGRENIPASGPVILAPNHVSLLDPPFVGVTCGRKPFIMAKEELFSGIQGWAIQRMGSFPVRRGGGDRAALRRAKNLLSKGELLLIFPEGTRSRTGELGPPEPGVAMLAHMNKAPVIPVFISGTEKAFSPRGKGFRFVKAKIVYGKPLLFEAEYAHKADRETLEQIGARIMDEIGKLASH